MMKHKIVVVRDFLHETNDSETVRHIRLDCILENYMEETTHTGLSISVIYAHIEVELPDGAVAELEEEDLQSILEPEELEFLESKLIDRFLEET